MQPRLFHLHALSALHCGTGQSAGVVDLPIARARATQLPIVPGSSLRGVLRQHVTDSDQGAARTLFGPEKITGDQDSFAGALAIGDAHLLVLPVRCLAGIVSYVTAPFILRRYARDLARAGIPHPPELRGEPGAGEAWVPSESVNRVEGKLVLEDLDLAAQGSDSAKDWAVLIAQNLHPDDAESQSDFIRRFAVLPDSIMSFLAETATEVRARIAVDADTGTVRTGALWYEENLPAEAALWGIFALSSSNNSKDSRSAADLARVVPSNGTLLQLGGNAGVGGGLIRFLTEHVEETKT